MIRSSSRMLLIVGLALVLVTIAACAAPATQAPAPTSAPAQPAATNAPAPATAVPAPAATKPPAAATNFGIAIGVDMDTLDPVQLTTTTVANVLDYMAETLTTIDQDGKLLPMLAKSWTISPDGLT